MHTTPTTNPPSSSQSLDLLLPRHFSNVMPVSMVVSRDRITAEKQPQGIYKQSTRNWYLQTVVMVTEWIGGFGLRLTVTCLNGEGGGALAGLEIQCKQVPLISKFRQLTNRLLILIHLIILYHLLLEQPDSQVS